MKIKFLLFLFFTISITIPAQEYVDLLKFKYANTPLNQFDSTLSDTRIQEILLDLTYPILLKGGNAVVTGLTYGNIRTKVNPAQPDLTSVYTIMLKVGMNFKHGERWTGTYMFLPKLSSDLKKVGAKDFQYGALVTYKFAPKSEHFKYQFGVYYNSELFGPFIVPLLGLYYMSHNNKLEINATLPVWFDINYRFYKWFRAGFSFSAFVRSYNLNDPQFSENGEYLVKSSNEPMLYLQFEPIPSLIIQTKVGYSIGRQYRIYDIEDRVTWGFSAFRMGDEREQLNSDFADGMLLEARLLYRFLTNGE